MRSVSGAKKAAIIWIQPLRRKFSIVRAPERLKKSSTRSRRSKKCANNTADHICRTKNCCYASTRVPEFVDALKGAPPRKEYLARKPLVRLVEELGKKKLGHVHIRKGDFSLTVQRTE